MIAGKKPEKLVWPWLVAAFVVFIADQVIKWVMVSREPSLGEGFVRIHLVWNTGASFGMLQGGNALLIWVSIIVIGLFMLYHDRLSDAALRWGILACAGVLGNLVDRSLRGAVVDFIDIGPWPVFNLADSMIVVGIALLAFTLWMEDRAMKKKHQKA